MTVELTELYKAMVVLVALGGAWNVMTASTRTERRYEGAFWAGILGVVGGLGLAGYGFNLWVAGLLVVGGVALAFGSQSLGVSRRIDRLEDKEETYKEAIESVEAEMDRRNRQN